MKLQEETDFLGQVERLYASIPVLEEVLPIMSAKRLDDFSSTGHGIANKKQTCDFGTFITFILIL